MTRTTQWLSQNFKLNSGFKLTRNLNLSRTLSGSAGGLCSSWLPVPVGSWQLASLSELDSE